AASKGASLAVEGCANVRIGSGTHTLRAVPGARTGFDLDQISLASIPSAGVRGSTAPRTHVTRDGSTSIDARVTNATKPFWLVLGESFNKGWHAEVNGRDLGAPRLVDGIANGWRVDPGNR